MAKEKVAVVGLGYVGIPLAALVADKGYDVVGIDIDRERVEAVAAGKLPLKGDEPGLGKLLARVVAAGRLRATTSFEGCADRTIIFVCVDTPIDAEKKPIAARIEDPVAAIARRMRKGSVVVIESTVSPGTTLGLVASTIERESGLKLGDGFGLVHCPERVMPGRLLYNLTHYDRVLGSSDKTSGRRVSAIYSKLTKGKIHQTDLVTAEITKTAENAYRDVQIAFANEVALICEKAGADAFEVRRLVNTCPFRDMHQPGAGVGGHCLPKDPWLLVHGGRGAGPKLIPAARAVNDSMPYHVVDLAHEALGSAGRAIEESVVAVMGASFLQNTGDQRNSPSVPVIESLRHSKQVRVHDPFLVRIDGTEITKSVKEALDGADLAIFMVAHKEYTKLTPAMLKRLMRTPVVVDGRNIFSAEKMKRAGMTYRGLGKKII